MDDYFLGYDLGFCFPIYVLGNPCFCGNPGRISLGIYALRPREGVDLPEAHFKMPLYPVLPAISAIFSAVIFWGLNTDAKILMVGWFVIGLLIYFIYGIRHSIINKETH